MKVWGFFMLCQIQNCKCHHFFVYCDMNDKYKKYIDYIVKDIELPYLKSLEPYGLKQDEMDLVLGIVFNQPVHYIEPMSGVYDTNGKVIYYEYSNGFWVKWEYDIYYENSDGVIKDNR